METVLLVIAAAALIVVAVVLLRRDTPATGPRHDDARLHRERAGSDADVEDSDIDSMLDAINERRRRRQAREVGEELSDELLRGTWEDGRAKD